MSAEPAPLLESRAVDAAPIVRALVGTLLGASAAGELTDDECVYALRKHGGALRDALTHDAAAAGKDQAEERLAELERLFELQESRMGDAVQRWVAEDPETRELTVPDLGQLLEWLLSRDDERRRCLEQLQEAQSVTTDGTGQEGEVGPRSRHETLDVHNPTEVRKWGTAIVAAAHAGTLPDAERRALQRALRDTDPDRG